MRHLKRFIGMTLCLMMVSLVSLPIFAQTPVKEKKTVRISAIENEQTHKMAKDVVRIAYQQIGIEVEFDDLPARRALEWANSGITDGDLARINGTEKQFTDLIKISTPVTEFKGVVFTKKIERDIQSWEDLKGLSVGIITGIRYSDIGTKGLDRIFVKDNTQLFTLLSRGRIDVAVAARDAGEIEIHRNFSGSKIHIIGQPLHISPLFHFIHKKNKDLVPQLAAVFQKMHESGQIESIRKKAVQEALSQ